MNTITSRQNLMVQAFRELADTPDPSGQRLLLDGAHLVREAVASSSSSSLEVVAVAASRLALPSEEGQLARTLEAAGAEVLAVSDPAFAAMSPVKTPSGIIAIARRRPTTPAAICRHPAPFLLVAVDVQDPGNLGSLLRAAEAGGVTGAIVCGASASPFSWKALRGSMGSVLRLPVAGGVPTQSALTCLKESGVRTVAAAPRNGSLPEQIDWSPPVALLLGGEGTGLSHEVANQCDVQVTVPMAAPVESLNVAVAGAILIYAARRHGVLSDSRRT